MVIHVPWAYRLLHILYGIYTHISDSTACDIICMSYGLSRYIIMCSCYISEGEKKAVTPYWILFLFLGPVGSTPSCVNFRFEINYSINVLVVIESFPSILVVVVLLGRVARPTA